MRVNVARAFLYASRYSAMVQLLSGWLEHCTVVSNLKEVGFQLVRLHFLPFHSTAIDADGLLVQSRDENGWHGTRSTRGVTGSGPPAAPVSLMC